VRVDVVHPEEERAFWISMLRDPEQRGVGGARRRALEDFLDPPSPVDVLVDVLVDVIVVVVEVAGGPHRLIGEHDVRHECRGLVRVGQQVRHQLHVVRQELIKLPYAVIVRQLTGQNADDARRGVRVCRVGALEDRRIGEVAVDVGARRAFVSVQPQVIGAQCVDGDQQDVTRGLWRARAQREQCESAVSAHSLDENRVHGETIAAQAVPLFDERAPLAARAEPLSIDGAPPAGVQLAGSLCMERLLIAGALLGRVGLHWGCSL